MFQSSTFLSNCTQLCNRWGRRLVLSGCYSCYSKSSSWRVLLWQTSHPSWPKSGLSFALALAASFVLNNRLFTPFVSISWLWPVMAENVPTVGNASWIIGGLEQLMCYSNCLQQYAQQKCVSPLVTIYIQQLLAFPISHHYLDCKVHVAHWHWPNW